MGESTHRRTARRGRGQIFAFVVIALPAFIGAMGLAADVGNFYFNYVKLQTAADASVLSGVKYLPDQPCTAISTANIYATCDNGIASGEVLSTVTSYGSKCPAPASTPVPVACATPVAPAGCTLPAPPPSAETGCNLTINVQRTVPYYFARLVGVDSGTMNVSATATVAPAYSTYPEPIGLQFGTAYSDGAKTVLIFRPAPSGTLPANNWSTLALGGKSFTAVSRLDIMSWYRLTTR
jgi:hypothetical protein